METSAGAPEESWSCGRTASRPRDVDVKGLDPGQLVVFEGSVQWEETGRRY